MSYSFYHGHRWFYNVTEDNMNTLIKEEKNKRIEKKIRYAYMVRIVTE